MRNFTDLTGRKAIVTGGTRGLGHGMAEGLMEAGAEVVIVGSSDTSVMVQLSIWEIHRIAPEDLKRQWQNWEIIWIFW